MTGTTSSIRVARLVPACLVLAAALAGCGPKTKVASPTVEPEPETTAAPEPARPEGIDPAAEPIAETLTLESGFGPEPRSVTLRAGGEYDASELGPECTGHIAGPPDVRLHYTAGSSSLNIYATSDVDTTLAVRLPDGSWLCNDDYLDYDPAVLMSSPSTGRYDIWLGSYDGGGGEATLFLSEEPPRVEVPAKGDLTRTPDVVFVPTPQAAVDKLLEMAEIGKGDILYDLGCGDGRFVITAAKKYGIRAWGFDIDPQRVAESRENVKKAGVERLVTIEHADIFTLDLSKADVITLYLLPRLNVALMPQLREMKPGSRIVSFDFDMRGAKPHTVINKDFDESGHRTLYKWVVPWEEE